jgi:precorrin-6A/cobalt-precorrin-6A reductase
MSAYKIDIVIAKNSGGVASHGKIAAAHALGIEVIMLRRPLPPDAPAVETVDDVVAWLDHALASAIARGMARGV